MKSTLANEVTPMAAYHFTGWIFHAVGRRLLDADKSPHEKASRVKFFFDYSANRFLKVYKANELRAPEPKERCAVQDIELLAGDDKIVWLTTDPTFGFTKSMEAWSFGFIYDPQILIEKYHGRVREGDFLNDYANILMNALMKYNGGRTGLQPDSKCVVEAFKSLQPDVRNTCLGYFKKETKRFRAENELSGKDALQRLEASPPPYEIVVNGPLSLDDAKAFVCSGKVVRKSDFDRDVKVKQNSDKIA